MNDSEPAIPTPYDERERGCPDAHEQAFVLLVSDESQPHREHERWEGCDQDRADEAVFRSGRNSPRSTTRSPIGLADATVHLVVLARDFLMTHAELREESLAEHGPSAADES